MILRTNFLGDILLPISIRNGELSKLVRVFIKNTLIFDYEKEIPSAGIMANLATLMTQFSVLKFPVSVGAVHNYTCYLISPDNIMAFVKVKEALVQYMSVEGLVIENFECYGIAYETTDKDEMINANVIADDMSVGMFIIEPGNVPSSQEEIKNILMNDVVILGRLNILERESQIKRIIVSDDIAI